MSRIKYSKTCGKAVILFIICCFSTILIIPYPLHSFLEDKDDTLLQETAINIEKYRKGNFTITCPPGWEGQEIQINMTRHHFRFGANLYQLGLYEKQGNDEVEHLYRTHFADLFNYATIRFYWKWFEMNVTRSDNATLEAIKFCNENNIQMKGHPVVWPNSETTPTWFLQANQTTRLQLLENRVKNLLLNYSQITIWDLVNEPITKAETQDYAGMKPEDLVATCLAWARDVQPNAELLVNDVEIIENNYIDLNDNNWPGGQYFQMIKDLTRMGYKIDAIGIQSHVINKWIPLEHYKAILDQFMALGIPIHITELTPVSRQGKPVHGGFLKFGELTEDMQADMAERFYRFMFSHPIVEAITWWDFGEARNTWQKGGEMMRNDGTLKPVYHRLHQLIKEEWWTRLTVKVGQDRICHFRGFYGTYNVTKGNETFTVSFTPENRSTTIST
ncbi:MAG: endo-1,4-beta-xylanase [Promethearchaeota archaeon]